MIPRSLSLRNFMCYREGLPPLDFDGITIACLAGDNGAGKSALLDALTWVLWGEARLSSADDLMALGAVEMEVDLIFALDGQDYRVIRKRSRAKKTGQTWLEFQARAGESWKSLTGATLRETQSAIIGTLRMDYEIFANSAYLRQGRADEFTRKEPGQRKQVLADILGLTRYEQLEEKARTTARELDGRTRTVDGQIEAYTRQAALRDEYLRAVERAREQAEHAADQVARAGLALDAASAQIQALDAQRALRDERRRAAERLADESDRLTADVARAATTYTRAAEHVARRAETLAGIADLEAAHTQRAALDRQRPAYDALQLRRTQTAQQIRDAEAELRAELRAAEADLRGLRERAARRPQISAEIARINEDLKRYEGVDADLETARTQRAALAERSGRIGQLQLRRAEVQKTIDLRQQTLTTERDQIKQQVREANERLRPEERLRSEAHELVVAQTAAETDRQQLTTLRSRVQELVQQAGAQSAEEEATRNAGEEINRKLALIATGKTEICPVCRTPLGADGVAHIEAEYGAQRQELRARFTSLRGDGERLRGELTTQETAVHAVELRLASDREASARLAGITAELRGLDTVRHRREELQQALSSAELVLMKHDFEHGARAEVGRLDSEITAIGAADALQREIRRLDSRIDELVGRGQQRGALQVRLDGERERLRAIEQEDPAIFEQEAHAARLQAAIAGADFAPDARRALADTDAELAILGYDPAAHSAAAEAERTLAHWAEQHSRLQRAEEWIAENLARLDEDRARLATLEAERMALDSAIAALDEQLRALAAATRTRESAADALRDAQREQSVRQKDLGEKQANLARADEAAAQLLESQARRREIAERKALFDELQVAFGKKGVQAMLIESAIPELEHEANTLLGRMTDNQMHLSFLTQGATKKGDTTETLEIAIADALGTRTYDAYSGGEAFRLDFAVRIALAKLLARRAGARLETLIIDEGFGSQDARGRERLVEAITSVQVDFQRILVITHIQELKDMFPVQIEITKTPQGSVWAFA